MAGWIVKYDGPCSKCGTLLRAGETAVWIRGANRMECLVCAGLEPEPAPSGPLDVGVAGGSAWKEYDRRSAKRNSRIEEQWGRFAGVVKALTHEPQSTRAWAVGAAGEEELARRIGEVDGVRILNDRRVPGTRGNIDHIVIAPAGIFVVDAKHMRGLIEIRNVGPFWRSDYRLFVGRRDKTSLAEGLGWQVEAVENAFIDAGVDPFPPITPVLCFINGEWPPFRAAEVFDGVRLEGPKSIKKLLTARRLISDTGIDLLAGILAEALPAK